MSHESIPTRPRARRLFGHLLKAAIAGLTVWFAWRLVAGIEWSDLAARMAVASRALLGLAVACLLGRFVIWNYRWWLAMRRLDPRPRRLFGFFALVASAAINLVVPTVRIMGGLARARYLARASASSFGRMYGVVLFDQVAHNGTMAAITWLALIVVSFLLGYVALGWATLAALLAAAVAVVIWSRRSASSGTGPLLRFTARLAERATGSLQRLLAHSHEAVEVFLQLLADTRLRWQAVALGAGFFALNAFAQWVIFHAISAQVSAAVVVAAVSLGAAAGMLTGTPGGLGTTEAAMIASFVALGVGEVDAAAATLLFRGLHYAIVLGVGLPALLVLELRSRPEPAEAVEAD